MRLLSPLLGLLLLILAAPINCLAADTVHHRIQVKLVPDRGDIEVTDRIRLPLDQTGDPAGTSLSFSLNRNLRIVSPSPEIVPLKHATADVRLYRVQLPPGVVEFSLRYQGTIRNELENISDSVGRSLETTRGTIGDQGVYLDGASYWYPEFDDGLANSDKVSFDMELSLPDGWKGISQGSQEHDGGWSEHSPQQEIYLVAGRFTEYREQFGEVQAFVYLRQPDAELAEVYLNATGRYIVMYSQLIGAYPYAKFALVENFWESGYGMPSFTLLGSTVLRLPFIVHTSYPHEILHNWWGNGVYVDYAGGNWSEGLTAYLADHYLRELAGTAAEYRRDALQKFTDYVHRENDFPLRQFRGRHGDASAAVGYDKSMMVFHMLRRQLGDQEFFQGLRRFYQDNRFEIAGYRDLEAAMQAASGTDLQAFFRQWLNRPGAPKLALADVALEKTTSGYALRMTIKQVQSAPPFVLDVPIRITLTGGGRVERSVTIRQRETAFSLAVPELPVMLDVDPDFDVFRELDAGEMPSSLSAFFGAGKAMLVLPAKATPALRQAYTRLAKTWSASRPGQWKTIEDNQLEGLPEATAALVLGRENRFYAGGEQAARKMPAWGEADARAFMAPGSSTTRLYVTASTPAGVDALARKLPHYGKYSYVDFSGEPLQAGVKDAWPVSNSPLHRCFGATGLVVCGRE